MSFALFSLSLLQTQFQKDPIINNNHMKQLYKIN